MNVQSIGALNFKAQRTSNSQQIQSSAAMTRPQNNTLIDTNYGKSLVSFKSQPKILPELSEKIGAAFSSIGNNDMILVGKNLKTAQMDLKNSADKIKDLIKTVVFIADAAIVGTFAIRKNYDGFDEVYNLDKNPMFINRENPLYDEEDNVGKEFFLMRGQSAVLKDKDYIHTKTPAQDNAGIIFEGKSAKTVLDFPEDVMQFFDMPSVKEINKKNIETIKEKTMTNSENNLTFADIGAQDEAIEELRQKVIYPIKYPNFYKNLHTKNIQSAMLVGSPGNGKTLIANALANELGMPFYKVNGQLLKDMWYGNSEKNIHAKYQEARENAPCILFFDEADAIFGKRTGVHKASDEDVNMHLQEISDIEKSGDKVFLLAATNKPENMDEAILRSGRFGTKIEIKSPDTPEKCEKILDIYIKNSNIENFNKTEFTKKLAEAKLSGADIASLVSEAEQSAIGRLNIIEQMKNGTFDDSKEFKFVLSGEDFDNALNKIVENNNVAQKNDKSFEVKGFRMD